MRATNEKNENGPIPAFRPIGPYLVMFVRGRRRGWCYATADLKPSQPLIAVTTR